MFLFFEFSRFAYETLIDTLKGFFWIVVGGTIISTIVAVGIRSSGNSTRPKKPWEESDFDPTSNSIPSIDEPPQRDETWFDGKF